MSFIPPQSLNDAWALLTVISDHEKAKKALEELKAESDQSLKALEAARAAQVEANALKVETDQRVADFQRREAELMSAVNAKLHDLDAKAEVLNNREAVLNLKSDELVASRKSLEADWASLDQREKAYKERLNTLNEMDRNVCEREARVKAILDELGPLAQKLQGK